VTSRFGLAAVNITATLNWSPVSSASSLASSIRSPGGAGGKTGGDRTFVPMMALAAKGFGADGYFMEIHPDPDHALSDGPNMVKLQDLEKVMAPLV